MVYTGDDSGPYEGFAHHRSVEMTSQSTVGRALLSAVIVVTAACPASPPAAATPNSASVLRTIEAQARGVGGVTTVVEESDRLGSVHARSQIWIKGTKRRRAILDGDHSAHVEIEHGPTRWVMLHGPKRVDEFRWASSVYFITSPIPELTSGHISSHCPAFTGAYVERTTYQGVQSVGGEPCHVFAGDQESFAIAVQDGLVREVRQFAPGQVAAQGVQTVCRFVEIKSHAAIDDALFVSPRVPGATLTVHEVDGQQSSTTVPYETTAPAPSGHVEGLKTRWTMARSFTATYHDVSRDRGQKIGGVEPTSSSQGKLRVVKTHGLKVRLDYEKTRVPQGGPYTQVYFYDGAIEWFTETGYESPASMRPRTPNVITKLDVDAMRNAVQKLQQSASPSPPGRLIVPSAATGPGGSYVGTLPHFVWEPLAGLEKAKITYRGQEELDGVSCAVLEVAETPDNRRSTHWVGSSDGVPRKIEEFDWQGRSVQRTITLDHVVAGAPVSENELPPDPTKYLVIDQAAMFKQAAAAGSQPAP